MDGVIRQARASRASVQQSVADMNRTLTATELAVSGWL